MAFSSGKVPPPRSLITPPVPPSPKDNGVLNDNPRFLFKGELDIFGGNVVLASYPRSGNSMLRSFLEKLTNLATGSDMDPRRGLSAQLTHCGFKGEGICKKAWVIKSHFPERLGWKVVRGKRVILLVRNPFDAIDSYFNMLLTMSHNKGIHEEEYIRHQKRWRLHVLEEMVMWNRFNSYWKNSKLPLHIVRYEDLLFKRVETLDGVLCFLSQGGSGNSNANVMDKLLVEWRARLSDMARQENWTTKYVPGQGGVCRSLRHYSNDLLKEVRRLPNIFTALSQFGYLSILDEKKGTFDSSEAFQKGNEAEKNGNEKKRNELLLNDPKTKVDGEESLRPRCKEDPSGRGFTWRKDARKLGYRIVFPKGSDNVIKEIKE